MFTVTIACTHFNESSESIDQMNFPRSAGVLGELAQRVYELPKD